jgi:hypothetical protein
VTAKDLVLVARGIAPVVREYVTAACAEREKSFALREQALEARLSAAEHTITELREQDDQLVAKVAIAIQAKAQEAGLFA